MKRAIDIRLQRAKFTIEPIAIVHPCFKFAGVAQGELDAVGDPYARENIAEKVLDHAWGGSNYYGNL